ncbi:MAG: metallophosphoesterase [Spirochaetae bacterium HGW-Spirochaetae-3]|jgi:UDP-2,3-diacylglucosamine pyrophosphatase LpxH|nr:MAG: metallophosphoesterase [Spirochaetae bacterium HGW-Spirochaetae-3]
MKAQEFMGTMRTMFEQARRESLGPDSRIVFLSDLHMGDRGPRDDFRHNAELVVETLSERYLAEGWKLVLNGDVEELHKFKPEAIRSAYDDVYGLFGRFAGNGDLVKILGNHDLAMLLYEEHEFRLEHALRLDRADGSVLAFHGHQSSKFFMKYNYLSDFIVRYIANPLKIKNEELPVTSKRRFKAERRIYRASKELGVVTIAGHTHRPLFESFSKYDTLRWTIESLLRRYTAEAEDEKERIASLIAVYSAEFKRLSRKERGDKVSRSLYEREELLAPCMFNSGCATGRSGYTAIEIRGDDISLVYWTRSGRARPYIDREALYMDTLAGTPWIRYTVATDSLEYIMARARLLA